MKTRLILLLLCCLILPLGACHKKSEPKAKDKSTSKAKSGAAKADASKAGMTITGANGDKVEIAGDGKDVGVPADFPKDVFVYPGAKVGTSIVSAGGSQLTLESSDAADKVAAAYAGKMKSSGWTEKSSVKTGPMTMLSYGKDQREVTVMITSGDGQATQIMLTVGAPKDAGK